MNESSKTTSSPSLSVEAILHALIDDLSATCPDNFEDFEWAKKWVSERIDDPTLVPSLCQLGKNLEITLIAGTPLVIPPFFERHGDTCLPELLYPLWKEILHFSGWPIFGFNPQKKIFTDSEGYFFPLPSSLANHLARVVTGLRQFFLFYSKNMEIPSMKKEEDEITAFVSRCTRRKSYLDVSSKDITKIRKIISEILDDPDLAFLDQWLEEPYGKHGPGAVFEGEKGRAKWDFETISGLPERLFTYYDLIGSHSHLRDRVSKLAIVPKDFRGHRLICVEQKENMFYQQGLRSVIEALIRHHPQASACIDFSCQEKSFWKSKDRGFTTIDLSDASDNITLGLAKLLLPRRWYKAISLARSQRVLLPSGEEISSEIFLTMGNALCFPVETLIFYAIATAAITSDGYQGPMHKVLRVFGDDILCSSRYAPSVLDWLSEFQLPVNYQKYCYNTLVRESCGSWWYAGIDCRIARPKRVFVNEIPVWGALLTTAKELSARGFHCTAEVLANLCDTYRAVPFGFSGLPDSEKLNRKFLRYNTKLQRLEFKMPDLDVRVQHLDGVVGLYDYFVRSGSRTSSFSEKDLESGWVDVNHLLG